MFSFHIVTRIVLKSDHCGWFKIFKTKLKFIHILDTVSEESERIDRLPEINVAGTEKLHEERCVVWRK